MTELFLICALSVAPVSHADTNHAYMDHHRSFYRLLPGPDRTILVVGGNPAWVLYLRQYGSKAFGALTDDRVGTTIHHAVCEAGALAFGTDRFDSVWWQKKNPVYDFAFDWLREAARVVQPGAFLLFDESDYLYWTKWLYERGWKRSPFKYKDYAIWQKPYYGDYRRDITNALRGLIHANPRRVPLRRMDQGQADPARLHAIRSAA